MNQSLKFLATRRRRIYVRRNSTEKMAPQCIVPTVKYGGDSIMVWGCFSRHDTTEDFVKIEDIMKKENYKRILQIYAIPFNLGKIDRRFILQQDNDPKLISLSKEKKQMALFRTWSDHRSHQLLILSSYYGKSSIEKSTWCVHHQLLNFGECYKISGHPYHKKY